MADTIEAKAGGRGLRSVGVTLPARRTPVYRSVDVLVCGGGLAGAAAAIAAARSGADTLLVERNVVLGGNGPLSFDTGLAPCDQGISSEIAARLRQTGDLDRDALAAQAGLVHDPEAMKYVLLDLVRESGAGLLLSSWVSDPIMRGETVAGALVENKSGRFAIPARVVIDATGDGELAVRAGAKIAVPATSPPMTMNARIGGIDFDRALAGRESWPRLVAEAKRTGALASDQPDTIALYGLTEAARRRKIAFLRGPLIAGRSACSAEDLTAAETGSRNLVRQFLAFLKTVPGFEASFLVDVAGSLALARWRHIVGDAALTLADISESRKRDDDILRLGQNFGIPYGCLLPTGLENLLVTGAAASISAEAFEALGAMSGAAMLGEAAGRAAAAAVQTDMPVRSLGPPALRKLREPESQGAKQESTAAPPAVHHAPREAR